MDYILSIMHASDWHLAHFQVFTIVNKTEVNILGQICVCTCAEFPLRCMARSQFLDPWACISSTSPDIGKLFSKEPALIYTPLSSYDNLCFFFNA